MWIGNDFDVGTLSNWCGGYLPPSNLCWWISTTIFAFACGLAMILHVGTLSNFVWWICGNPTTIFAWWIGNDLDVGTLSNLCGGYLPPSLHGGLAMI
jgi:hypothetical protein